MTTPETRTRLQQLEDRLAERTPPPLDGQTRIPLPPPTTADSGSGGNGGNEGSEGTGRDVGNGGDGGDVGNDGDVGNGGDGGTATP
ncbi:hypothetical protein [Streptomyces lavendofoliae]|uniref:hypothetical protein n=1 Tax=Streptomyces lavendofoliae TaxID=67314 RepID=UPI003D8BD319